MQTHTDAHSHVQSGADPDPWLTLKQSSVIVQTHEATLRREIRAYVSAVRDMQSSRENPLRGSELQHWVDWALTQADRVDPVLNGSFRTVQNDD